MNPALISNQPPAIKNKNLYIIRYTIIPLNVIAVRFFIRIAGVEPA
ncbi:hypothetical protein ZYGNAAKF_CDS0123 [Enterococcus phage VRE9_2]